MLAMAPTPPAIPTQSLFSLHRSRARPLFPCLTVNSQGVALPFTRGPFGSFVYLARRRGWHLRITARRRERHLHRHLRSHPRRGCVPFEQRRPIEQRQQHGHSQWRPHVRHRNPHDLRQLQRRPSFNPSSSTQSISFTIQPGFFAAVPSNQSQVTITAPGSSGSTSVSVSSSTGFSGTITLACSGLPAGAACQFTPSSIKAPGTLTTTPSTITVTTTAAAAELLRSPRRLFLAHWLPGLGLLFSVVLIGGPRRRRTRAMFLWLMLLLMVAVPGCGGGSSNSTPAAPPPVISTPTGSYNVVVTATSGSTTSSTGFALLVQ